MVVFAGKMDEISDNKKSTVQGILEGNWVSLIDDEFFFLLFFLLFSIFLFLASSHHLYTLMDRDPFRFPRATPSLCFLYKIFILI